MKSDGGIWGPIYEQFDFLFIKVCTFEINIDSIIYAESSTKLNLSQQ